jgi:hypothetical protein
VIPVVLPHGIGATQPRYAAPEPVGDVETLAPIDGETVTYIAPCDLCGVESDWTAQSYEHRSKANGTTKVVRAECSHDCALEVAA